MASLQTHVFVNDEWVTQTITAEELIGTTSHAPSESAAPAVPKPPTCGVLSRTIIESPVTRWVHPVQLRSSRFNDVALVGDRYVQISEFGPDCQLMPVAKKVYLDSRIRNCRVIGAHDYLARYRQDVEANYNKSSDEGMTGSPSPSSSSSHKSTGLFQEILVLVLSTGDLEFLFMSLTPAGDWEFISSRLPISSWRLIEPGFLMTISPDSRYIAIACSEGLFIVYQLKSMEELRKEHSEGVPIIPIQSTQARALKGAIHKLDFLHGGPESTSHNVLLVITARSGVFRLATFEWEDSEGSHSSFIEALNEEKLGVRLDGTAGIPLLIIPLMVSRQFLIIKEHSMEICSDVLTGSPVFNPFQLTPRDATDWHHGSHSPIWTAWTRPLREESYHSNTDLIYLAREDGWVNFLEISDSGIEASIYMGPLECNVDSAFAAVSIPHGDVLVAGGIDGPGHIWSVEARQDPRPIGQLPNWSPTLDLVLTHDASKLSKSDNRKLSKRTLSTDKTASHTLAPGKIFACSGRDASGAIVELRHGIQAKIGLDLLYTSPIKKCWAIPSFNSTSEEGFFVLLALPEHSAVLHISQDLSEVTEKDQSAVDFDLLSTTLAVYSSEDIIVQITTMHVTIVSADGCYQHSISDMIEEPLATVTDAAMTNEILALSVYSHGAFKMMVFDFDKTKFLPKGVFEVEGEVTALSVAALSVDVCVMVGLSHNDLPVLSIFPISWTQFREPTATSYWRASIELKLGEDENAHSMPIDAVTSIISIGNDKIVVGMRNGGVVTIHRINSCPSGQGFKVARTNHFGMSPSHVFTGPVLGAGPSSLVCNDAGLAIMKEPDEKSNRGGCFEQIWQVWLTDASEPHFSPPIINSVTGLRDLLDSESSVWAMVAGAHIFITEIQPVPTPVPRHMSTGGTPKGILYSERLEALVTVVIKRGIPSLHFFDPLTGNDLSHPIKKGSGSEDVDVDYIPILGDPGVKIVSLLNWRYKNEGNIYEWFVILTRSEDSSQGCCLVVSAEQEAVATTTGTERRIRFWGQFTRKIKAPRSGTTDDNGLFLNFGKVLEYHVIKDRKFNLANKYELPSPAASLQVIDGRLHVLTTHHSLIILDYMENTGLPRPKMLQLYTDEIARNGLHSIGIGLCTSNSERQQRLILVSDPMCGVYGLWPQAKGTGLRLTFEATLGASIRKFAHGYTRPRWTKDRPRCGNLPVQPDRRSILGLAIDGSLTQFSLLHHDAWRLLRCIRCLAASNECSNIPYEFRYNSTDCIDALDPLTVTKDRMHINGDVLQHCLDKKMLEGLFSTPEELILLRWLLVPFGLDAPIGDSTSPEQKLAAFEYAYGLLEYYLSPAL
ncbi:mono-functional DNA-alkylating methyl methanesulfonate N-term-domain-containing protein [Xylaria sp. FL0933]|nr:mono-functional DNA-alkylating methyl methanesulfonate N-term-domain-containing protein [Xylaria sp. FL0933]